jgi:site-specific DNA-methyltransferase (adenine-specific)
VTINRSTYIVGDVRDCLAATPDGSVDLVMTSPPFLALRSYLPADHPDKHREIGSEPDPATFLDTLLLLTAEWGRVLAPHGSICVELGDTYSGSGNGDDPTYHPDGGNWSRRTPARGWPLPKSLCGIPHLYHLSLAYGRNLLTGEESPAGRWRVRNVVAWCRPNPPVGALGDKFRPATSYMTVATRAQRRYFDLDAVRADGPNPNTHARTAKGVESRPNTTKSGDDARTGGNRSTLPIQHTATQGAPPLDYWVIPTAHYSGSHYAVYPPALCERPIKSMVPAKVCTVCGAPSERIVEAERTIGEAKAGAGRPVSQGGPFSDDYTSTRTTIGWSECECPDDGAKWRPGLVLDPFAGSGTTLMVANELERDAVGFDIDARNATLARQRVDKFMFADFEVYPLSLLGFLAPQIRL